IWDNDPRMIVMSHVPGYYLSQARKSDTEDEWREACRQTGCAIAALIRAPLSPQARADFDSRFYIHSEQPTLKAYLCRILELGRSIHTRDPVFRDGYWKESLDFMASQLPAILN